MAVPEVYRGNPYNRMVSCLFVLRIAVLVLRIVPGGLHRLASNAISAQMTAD